MKHKPVILAVLGVPIVVAAGFVGFHFQSAREEAGLIRVRPEKRPDPLTPAAKNNEVTLKYLAAEKRERELDQEFWRDEMEALKHGEWIHLLWDQLNQDPGLHSPETFRLLPTSLSIEWPEQLTARQSDWIHGNKNVRLPTVRDCIQRMQQTGWQLAQSEWHHVGFRPSKGEREASSKIQVLLQFGRTDPGTPGRASIEITGWIRWRTDGTTALPSVLQVEKIQDQVSHDPIPFQSRANFDISLRIPGAENRLLCQDLDRNGLPDLVLPASNRILWNHGNFRFEAGPLFERPQSGLKAALLIDFDRDGNWDLVAADTVGLWFYKGLGKNGFAPAAQQIWRAPESLQNPFILTSADLDEDGDPDFFLGQFKPPVVGGQMPAPFDDANDGFPSYLLRTGPDLHCIDVSAGSGLELKRHRRLYSACFVRSHLKAGLILVLAGDFAGLDLFEHLGGTRFADRTRQWAGESRGFGMALCLSDFNRDGWIDIWMTGMNSDTSDRLASLGLDSPENPGEGEARQAMSHGNRLWSATTEGFSQVENDLATAARRTGWSWGTVAFDANNDGWMDLYIANGHISGGSTRDYEPRFWRHDIRSANSREDPVAELLLQAALSRELGGKNSYGGHQINRFFAGSGNGWNERAWVDGIALKEDGRNVLAADLDADGLVDLAIVSKGNRPAREEQLTLYRNQNRAGNWIGLRLHPTPQGIPLEGTAVRVVTAAGVQLIRAIVNGDGYLTQLPAAVHFGLGTETEIRKIEVQLADGSIHVMEAPPINRWFEPDLSRKPTNRSPAQP